MRWITKISLLCLVFGFVFLFNNLFQFFSKPFSSLSVNNNQEVFSNIFQLNEFSIYGNKKTKRENILKILSQEENSSIFNVNIESLREKIIKLKWVKSVIITRILPNKISINIVEYKPFAVWQNKGFFKLINQEGVIITSISNPIFDLPLIIGESAPKYITELFLELNEQPETIKNFKVASNYRGRRWDIILDSGTIIKLPEKGIKEALSKVLSLEDKDKIFSMAIKIIDLRVDDRLFLTLRKGYKINNKNTNIKEHKI